MSTSGNYDLSLTLFEVVEEAFDVLQIGQDGESLSADMIKRAKSSINIMIKNWQAQSIHLWSYTEGVLFLKVGQAKYDFATANLANEFFETTTTTSGLTGEDTFTVADGSNIKIGDNIAIILDDNDSFFSTVVPTPTYELSTAVFSGNSFSVATQDTSPSETVFSTDGLKMFVVGFATDAVYSYNLTTAFNINTAIFSGNSFSVAAQDIAPRGIIFDTTGLKMFVVGAENNSVYSYDLATAFDFSVAPVFNTSFSVTSEDISPSGMFFDPTGLKMFISGIQNSSVYSYNLTTAFNISTASFSGDSFSVIAQDDNPTGVVFDSTGFQMIVVGNQNDNVYSYILTTAFDLSTTSFSGDSFSVSSEDSTAQGVTFDPSGIKMFITGDQNNSVFSYDLPNNISYDITAARFSGDSFSVKKQDVSPQEVVFIPDGFKMFIVGTETNSV